MQDACHIARMLPSEMLTRFKVYMSKTYSGEAVNIVGIALSRRGGAPGVVHHKQARVHKMGGYANAFGSDGSPSMHRHLMA